MTGGYRRGGTLRQAQGERDLAGTSPVGRIGGVDSRFRGNDGLGLALAAKGRFQNRSYGRLDGGYFQRNNGGLAVRAIRESPLREVGG